jgi:transposase InsO family protein
MSRKANPYDHAKAESFMKTLKYEEVYREDYRDLIEAHAGIGHFLEQVYNQKRLHSAVGYRLSSARRVRVLAAGRPGRNFLAVFDV